MKIITNQVMKRTMGSFLVEQRTKDLVPSFDELMNSDDKIENFSSLKEEFERKRNGTMTVWCHLTIDSLCVFVLTNAGMNFAI